LNLTELFKKMTPGRALIFGVALAILYYFLMFDDGKSFDTGLAAANAKVGELKQKLADDQRKIERAIVFKKTAAEIGTTINKLLGMIPEKFGMADLMRIISNEAKVAGVSLSSISPGKSEQSAFASEFDEITVSLDMNGSYVQHMVFLSNLTKINQIMIVKKFDMSSSGAEDSAVVKMTAEIIAYRYRGGKKDGKAEGQKK
jgi:Tfp pilus assembly protein PilO